MIAHTATPGGDPGSGSDDDARNGDDDGDDGEAIITLNGESTVAPDTRLSAVPLAVALDTEVDGVSYNGSGHGGLTAWMWGVAVCVRCVRLPKTREHPPDAGNCAPGAVWEGGGAQNLKRLVFQRLVLC